MTKDVILCKDCLYRQENVNPAEWWLMCTLHDRAINDDDFCSDAKAKKKQMYSEKEMDALVNAMELFLKTHKTSQLMELVTDAISTKEE